MMSDSGSIAAAVAFVDRLNAGELPALSGLRLEIEEAVVDGCVVVLFGVARPAGPTDRTPARSPVACRVVLEEEVVTDWRLYGAGELRPPVSAVAASA